MVMMMMITIFINDVMSNAMKDDQVLFMQLISNVNTNNNDDNDDDNDSAVVTVNNKEC
jgi:hypothetical protein